MKGWGRAPIAHQSRHVEGDAAALCAAPPWHQRCELLEIAADSHLKLIPHHKVEILRTSSGNGTEDVDWT